MTGNRPVNISDTYIQRSLPQHLKTRDVATLMVNGHGSVGHNKQTDLSRLRVKGHGK